MQKVLVLGIKDETYVDKNTGEQKRSREIHMMEQAPPQKQDGFRGNRVVAQFVNFDVSGLETQKWYIPEWVIQRYGSRTFATLMGLTPVKETAGEKEG